MTFNHMIEFAADAMRGQRSAHSFATGPAVLSPERLALTHDDRGENLLAKIRLPLLHRRHHHAARGRARDAVEPGAPTLDGDDVEVLRAGVVGAVHHRAHRARDGHLVLRAGGDTAGSWRGWARVRVTVRVFRV
eukprot:30414-Pelagococcus_subviridis.AAC.7